MKRILLLPIFMVLLLSFNSCQKDDSLDPRPVIVSGSFMRLVITNKRLNFDDLNNTSFGGLLTNPGGTVVKYNLYVRRTDIFGYSPEEFKLVKTITSFPAQLAVTPADIATALGIAVTDLQFGEVYRFYGEAYDAAGVRTDYYNLSTTIQSNPNYYFQAFRFGTDMTDTAHNDALSNANFNNYIPQ